MKKNLRSMVAVLLVVCMLCSFGAVPAAAADPMTISVVFMDESYTEIDTAVAGDIVYMGIKMENYVPIISYDISVSYNNELLTFASEYIDEAEDFDAGYFVTESLGPTMKVYDDLGRLELAFASDKVVKENKALDDNGYAIYFAFEVKEGAGKAEASFNTVQLEGSNLIPGVYGDGNVALEVTYVGDELNCVEAGVNLSTNAVTVDGTNDQTVTATVIDTDGTEVSKPTLKVTYGANNEATTDVTVKGTTITVDAKAKAGTYWIAYGDMKAALEVTRAESAASSISLSADKHSLARPYAGADSVSATLTAVIYDQFGDVMDKTVTWENATGSEGNTATFTADSTTVAGEYTVTARLGELIKASVKITVTQEKSKVTKVDIAEDTYTLPSGGSITIPVSVYDQYGNEMEGQTIKWTASKTIAGVTIDDGVITASSEVGNDSFTITAAVGSVKDTATVNVAGITFEGAALTVKDAPTYGDTWAEIVTVTEPIATVNGVTVEGDYSLNVEGTPDAGTYTVELRFTDKAGKYVDVLVCSVDVVVAPKSVAVVWSNTALTYNGEAQAPTATAEGVELTVSGAQTNAGTYIATASTSDTNYTLTNAEVEFTIAPKSVAVVWTNTALTYNGEAQAPTATADALELTVTGAAANAGSYTATASTDDTNYTLTNASTSFTIAPCTEFTDATVAAQNVVVNVGDFGAAKFTGIGGEAVEGTLTYTYGGSEMGYDAIKTELAKLAKGDTATIGYSFTASGNYSGTKTGTITVTMVDIIFMIGEDYATVENALTIKADPTYGDTWAKIVSAKSNIVASVNGETVSGQYSFNVEGSPNAGTYTVQLLFNGGKYVNVVVCETEITVAPKSVAVKWSNTSLTYNGTEQAPTASASGVGGETVELTVSGAQTNAGTYTATASTANTNYTLTNAEIEYTIAPKSVKVVWGETKFTYNGEAQAPAATAEGVELTVSGAQTDAGSYKATASTTDTNYTLTNTEIKFTIAPMSVEVVWGSTELTYNGTEQAPEATATGAKDEAIVLAVSGKGKDVGSYKATASTENGNYSLTNTSVNFTIAAKAITVVVEVEDQTFTGEALEPAAVSGNGGEKLLKGIDYTIEYADNVNAGTATVTVSPVAGSNYSFEAATKTFAIAKAAAPVLGVKEATVYNASEVGSEKTVTVVGIPANAGEVKIGDTVIENGAVTFTVPESGNVVLSVEMANYETAELTINITLTEKLIPVVTASNVEAVYGQELTVDAANASAAVDGAAVEGAFTWNFTGVNAGTYTVEVTFTPADTDAYETVSVMIMVIINKASYEGKPSYNTVDEDGKTLADAALQPNEAWGEGELIWKDKHGNVLDDSTVIEQGVTYYWVFTPADSNYEVLSGSVVLYANNNYYVPSVGGGSTGEDVVVDTETEGGSVEADVEDAKEGDTVTVVAQPEEGYEVDEIIVVDANGNVIEVVRNADGSYSFEMPAGGVTISASFVKKGLAFTDVAETDWFYDVVHYAYYNGLMNGVSETQFAPGMNLTRGMMMTILARLAGEDTTGGDPWYEKGMNWAVAEGISDGTNPEANITREQAVTMLYRYIGEPEVSENGLEKFSDGAETSEWAVDAMNWAISVGLLQGDNNGEVNPGNNATRAEIAAIFVRFIENVLE